MFVSASHILLLCSFIFINFHKCFAEKVEIELREPGFCPEDCLKQILRKVFLKTEPLDSSSDTVDLKFSLSRLQYEKLVEYVSVDNSWTSGEEVLDELASTLSIVQDDFEDHGHIYQEGFSPKTLILLCTGSFAIAITSIIITGGSKIVAMVVTLAFFSGLAWNWWKLYTEEYHRRVHLLPPECKQKSSWYHSFKSFIIDPQCSEYFKTPVNDPLSMVSPGKILEATFTMLVIDPVSQILSLLTRIVHDLSTDLVWPLNWIFPAVLAVMVLWAIIIAIQTLLASLLNREFSFSFGLIEGKVQRAIDRNHAPQRQKQKTATKSKSSPSFFKLNRKQYTASMPAPAMENKSIQISPPAMIKSREDVG